MPYHPEERPCEELYWDEPLESIEPLLFVLKGLSSRLSARLEGRGQAAQALLLTVHYDRSIAALRNVSSSLSHPGDERCQGESAQPIEQLPFRLASPLVHAEDFERIVRSRLQRLTLLAPAVGLSLQTTSVTEARHCQLDLQADVGLSSTLASDPRAMAVLVAELAADIGDNSVGVLVTHDSHLIEKNSGLVPIQKAFLGAVPCQQQAPCQQAEAPHQVEDVFPKASLGSASLGSASLGSASLGGASLGGASLGGASLGSASLGSASLGSASLVSASLGDAKGLGIGMAGQGTRLEPLLEGRPVLRLPTRLLASPIELKAPIRKNELWVLQERAFVVGSIQFDQRLEAVEWWDSQRVFRDYFRIWLAAVEGRQKARDYPSKHYPSKQGLEALVYLDRENGKSYIQALYD